MTTIITISAFTVKNDLYRLETPPTILSCTWGLQVLESQQANSSLLWQSCSPRCRFQCFLHLHDHNTLFIRLREASWWDDYTYPGMFLAWKTSSAVLWQRSGWHRFGFQQTTECLQQNDHLLRFNFNRIKSNYQHLACCDTVPHDGHSYFRARLWSIDCSDKRIHWGNLKEFHYERLGAYTTYRGFEITQHLDFINFGVHGFGAPVDNFLPLDPSAGACERQPDPVRGSNHEFTAQCQGSNRSISQFDISLSISFKRRHQAVY